MAKLSVEGYFLRVGYVIKVTGVAMVKSICGISYSFLLAPLFTTMGIKENGQPNLDGQFAPT